MVQRGVHQSSLFSALQLELRNLAHDISRNPQHTVTSLNLDRFRRRLRKSFNCFQTTGFITSALPLASLARYLKEDF